MKTIDSSIEDASFAELDALCREAGITPSEFAARATAASMQLHKARDAARRDVAGYTTKPVTGEEFAMDPADLGRLDDENLE
jgi:hypothetical protein